MKIECCVISDIGCCRDNNEDNYYINGVIRDCVENPHMEYDCYCDNDSFLGAVFDGMGGEEKGELASLVAAKLLKNYNDALFEQIATGYIAEANKYVCDMMSQLKYGRMGSTLAIASIRNNMLSVCNLGDSPIFLIRDGSIKKISMDHNEAQILYDIGMIERDEIKKSGCKNHLTQHLGIYEEEMILSPYRNENIELKMDDYILLCSDGLTDMMDEQQLQEILQEESSICKLTSRLVTTAIKNGGKDNITALLIHIF